MDSVDRRDIAGGEFGALAGGPGATVRATARAMAKVDRARTLVLVEGITDQIAVEAAAAGRGRDLDSDRVVIVPIGGAHAISRFLTDLGSLRARVRLAGLCDLREADMFRRAMDADAGTYAAAADLGCHVCVKDLEDELIRAVGVAGVEELFATQGDLGLFRLFQSQPAWRGQKTEAQMYRFLRSSSRRNLSYARVLVDAAVHRDVLPEPLDALLASV